MSEKEINLIRQVDEAKLTPDKHIETKYGLGTIQICPPDDKQIRFNDADIVIGGAGYQTWWSQEYERREAEDL